jgi:predicted acetyltransferase
VFPIQYKNEFLDAWLARNELLTLGAFSKEDRLIGFVIVSLKSDHTLIEFLGVDPSYQKAGLGTTLLSHILRNSNSRVMLIPVNEPRVICWYKKHGFEPCGAPRISPYTGEIEQTMVFLPAGSAKIEENRLQEGITTSSYATVSREITS